MHDFVMNWLFRKYRFTEFHRSSKCSHTSFFSIKTITFIDNTSNLISKAIKFWDAVKLKTADANVPILTFFFGSLTSLARKYLPNIQDGVTEFIICRVLLHQIGSEFRLQLQLQKCFTHTSHFFTQNMKEVYTITKS